MDTNIAPVWSLFRDGTAHSTSKKSCLETAIAIAYLSALMAQREDNGPIYRPFINKLVMAQKTRLIEFASWFHDDQPTLGLIERLWDDPEDVAPDQLMGAALTYDVAPWAVDMVAYLAIAHNWSLVRFATGAPIPFYGMTIDGELYPTGYAIPFRKDNNVPLTRFEVAFPDHPFFRMINYALQILQPDMQDVGTQAIFLNSVSVLTDPLRRMTGDTILTALWEDLTAGITSRAALYQVDATDAFPQIYNRNTGKVTGLEWLTSVTRGRGEMEGPSISDVCSSLDRRCRRESGMRESNPNLGSMSLESLSAELIMAEPDTDDDDTDKGEAAATSTATPDTDTPPATTPTSTPAEDDTTPASTTPDTSTTPAAGDGTTDDGGDSGDAGEAAATSTDDTTPAPATDDTTPATDPTATTDPSAPDPNENNIAGLSYDTSGETRKDFLYRRGVLALASKINDDMDFPVSDEVRNLLKSFVEVQLFTISIKDVKDYMKELGLQTYLEAVSF